MRRRSRPHRKIPCGYLPQNFEADLPHGWVYFDPDFGAKEDILPDDLGAGIRLLAAAVLVRASKDAAGQKVSNNDYKNPNKNIECSQAWFRSDSVAPYSWRWVADVLRLQRKEAKYFERQALAGIDPFVQKNTKSSGGRRIPTLR